jgi:glycosyltransferase involved in cell wall biosynthesis
MTEPIAIAKIRGGEGREREWPRIALVTPVRNSRKYLEQTIRSVLAQDYPNLDYFVVDGGSTDGSVEIIRKCEKQISGWMSEPDNGTYDALNKGFAHTTGEIMGRISDQLQVGGLTVVGSVFRDMPPEVEWRSRLIRFGGSRLEAFQAEMQRFRASYRNPGMSYRVFKYFVVGSATLLLPPHRFYQLRDWYAGKQLGRLRNRLFRTSE